MPELIDRQLSESLQSLAYSGSVRVTTMNGKRVLDTHEYHNTGTPMLFKFMCNALAGVFQHNHAPAKIQLLYYKGTFSPESLNTYAVLPALLAEAEADPNNAEIVPCSTQLLYSTTPVIEYAPDGTPSVLFQFRIPYSLISAPNNEVNILALYPNHKSLRYADIMALYKCQDITNKWDPIQIEKDTTQNYSVLVEWRMTITNQTQTPTNVDM